MDDIEILARDEDCSDDLMDWWTFEHGIAPGTQVTCDSDEVALVVAQGRVIDRLDAGRHLLSAQGRPALARFIGDDASPVNVVFVWIRDFSLSFSGSAGVMVDPKTGASFETFITGGCGLEVTDPAKALALERPDSDTSAEDFLQQTLLRIARDAVAGAHLTAQSVADGDDLPEALIAKVEKGANAAFAPLGLSVSLDGDLALTDEEEDDEEDEDDEEEDEEEEGEEGDEDDDEEEEPEEDA
ncbi:MAG TPA: hypothetical protein VGK67_15100 [Myxococcales bacterium]|jgi:hypothetical protein